MAGAPILIGMTSHGTLGNTGRSTGAYIPEVAHAWKVFTDAGHPVHLMSVRGGPPPLDAVNREDPVQQAFLDDREMSERLARTMVAGEVEPADYCAVFFAGGHGAAWDLADDPSMNDLTRQAYERGAAIGAVCHGPCALLNVRLSDGRLLVAGKQISAFTDAEEKGIGMTEVVPYLLSVALTERGAVHVTGPSYLPYAVVDGRVVTGQNPASATLTAQHLLAVLTDK